MHMGMEHVGAKCEYAASCHSMEFINDVTITSSVDAVKLHVVPSDSAYANES